MRKFSIDGDAMENLDFLLIQGLHGSKNYKIDFKDNKLIIIGENGAGKTTILRILCYVLSGQITLLSQYDFQELSVGINGHVFSLKKKDIGTIQGDRRRSNRWFGSRYSHSSFTEEILRGYDLSDGHSMNFLHEISDKYGVPVEYVMEEYRALRGKQDSKKIRKFVDGVNTQLKSSIMYLPTYRRIERELKFILGSDKYKADNSYKKRRRFGDNGFLELVEFGMRDVEDSIEKVLSTLREFDRNNLNALTQKYLSDVVNRSYKEVRLNDIKESEERDLRDVLDRIPVDILSDEQKQKLYEKILEIRSFDEKKFNNSEYDKVVAHYFLKLLSSLHELRDRETNIREFCNICNNYMTDKSFDYDSTQFRVKIKNLNDSDKKELSLHNLSSGEKQVVSIFSHLYLGSYKNMIIIIDEPELSLSVPWQRQFLTGISSAPSCKGLVAVTHSPFVYENELDTYAKTLESFKV